MSGLIAQKLSMTQIARGDALVAVTLLRIPTTTVAQIKTVEKEGYSACVLATQNVKGKITKKKEVPTDGAVSVGDTIDVGALEGIAAVKLTAVSKGRGFTGAMKRWNFK